MMLKCIMQLDVVVDLGKERLNLEAVNGERAKFWARWRRARLYEG